MTIRDLQTGQVGNNLSKEFLTNILLSACSLASSFSFHFYGLVFTILQTLHQTYIQARLIRRCPSLDKPKLRCKTKFGLSLASVSSRGCFSILSFCDEQSFLFQFNSFCTKSIQSLNFKLPILINYKNSTLISIQHFCITSNEIIEYYK